MSTGKRLIYILWPAFIVAGIAEGVFFTLFDPTDLRLFDREIGSAGPRSTRSAFSRSGSSRPARAR
jgi:hypothetical protein